MTEETLKSVGALENYGKFLHRITKRIYVSKIEDLMKLEFDNKKRLYELPKSTLIKCYEYSKKNGVSTKSNEFPLDDWRIITSISYGDLKEVFYTEE